MPLLGVRQNYRSSILERLTGDVERALTRRVTYGEPGRARGSRLATGNGWLVDDVVCNFGPGDRSFEEQHRGVSVGVVIAGTFQYRTGRQSELLVPGSLLLGNHQQCFECGHDHAAGDRCLSFGFSPEYFERIAADVGARQYGFRVGKLPPLRATSRACAEASAALMSTTANWDELGVQIAAQAIRLAHGLSGHVPAPRGAETRVTASVRSIERDPGARLGLAELAAQAHLSAFHYLRTFERVTGVTPHQFILRTRLREAAARLATDSARVVEIAFDAGFGDLSNFNRAFRAEFGLSPRRFRATPR
jgi:AraC family transcriptional regulator